MLQNISGLKSRIFQNMPPSTAVRKLARKGHKALKLTIKKRRDYYNDPRISGDLSWICNSYVSAKAIDVSRICVKTARYLSSMYLNHRFDLLGSGWILNSYNSKAPGIEGYHYDMNVDIKEFDSEGRWLEKLLLAPHLRKSREILRSISGNYIPIDWQKDYKSGYRWDTGKWYKSQRMGHIPGADIKVPWELARMQHLPRLAVFSLMFPEDKEKFLKEYRNEVLDFIALNPPRMGVNWVYAMDVGIRAANILMAYDIFNRIDEDNILDDRFRHILSDSIYEHGLHIVNNLEWSEKLTTNHYLSNVAGLLFISAYLPRTGEIDCWLAFAVQELLSEFKKQFQDDGTNFESSTSYHCLSMELMVYSTAMILGLNDEKRKVLKEYDHLKWRFYPRLNPADNRGYDIELENIFPEWFVERIFMAGKFIFDLTKPTNEIPLIGDNDSGCLFRISPIGNFMTAEQAKMKYINLSNYIEGEEEYWDENLLNHLPLLSGLSGLFKSFELCNCYDDFPLEQSIIKSLSKGNMLEHDTIAETSQPVAKNIENDNLGGFKFTRETIIKPDIMHSIPLTENLKLHSYPRFGVFIFTSDRIHLTVCAAPCGQNGFGGHSHNDKLSFELNMDGEDVIIDPGTYLYTPLPDRRNEFRSTGVHNTAVVNGEEQNRWIEGVRGLFLLNNETKVEVLGLEEDRIILKLIYRDIIHVREFKILEHFIKICDYSDSRFKLNFNRFKLYSNGYGKLVDVP